MRNVVRVGHKIEGHPAFPAPWEVQSYENAFRETVYLVRAADGLVVIQPESSLGQKMLCEAVVRSRNEGSSEEAIAYQKAKYQEALVSLKDNEDRIRAHFHEQISKLEKTNASLQDAIAKARKSGRVDDLPAWCQPSDESFTLAGGR